MIENASELQQAADEKAYAEFYRTPKQDRRATEAEGRPIFKMVEYVRISVPGDKSNMVDRPVQENDKRRFAPQYRAFTADKPQDEASGTLLTAWGGLPPERIAEYQFVKVMTVEQLANVSDGNLQKMGPGAIAERKRAKEYLEASTSKAPVLRLQAENASLRADLEALRNALKEQGDRLESLSAVQGLKARVVREVAPVEVVSDAAPEAPAPKRRGRPKGTKAAQA